MIPPRPRRGGGLKLDAVDADLAVEFIPPRPRRGGGLKLWSAGGVVERRSFRRVHDAAAD